MKSIVTSFLLIVVVCFTLFVSTKPASATSFLPVKITNASCKDSRLEISWTPGASGNTTNFTVYILDANYKAVDYRLYEASASAGGFSVTNIVFANPAHLYVGSGPNTFGPFECTTTHVFNDGRLDSDNALQPVSVYCSNNNTLLVYAIYKSQGYRAFTITQAEIDRFPKHPSRNTLIKAAKGVRLYRLTSGELQINSTTDGGSEYTLIVTTCVN